MGDEVVRIGAARSIQYLLRDRSRGFVDLPVYRVDAEGRLQRLGVLIPVRPDGYVMRRDDGQQLHSEGMPWWLLRLAALTRGEAVDLATLEEALSVQEIVERILAA